MVGHRSMAGFVFLYMRRPTVNGMNDLHCSVIAEFPMEGGKMKRRGMVFGYVMFLFVVLFAAERVHADALRIGIMQAQAGDAQKFQPLLDYLTKKGITASFVIAQDYPAAVDMFSRGDVDAMFSGSGIAGAMIIKGLANPLVRPAGADGVSSYSTAVIAPKGSKKFKQAGSYFNGKKVVFTSLATAGEFYFHSLGPSTPAKILKAPSHDAAIEALDRGQADVAIVKDDVWNNEKGKYSGLKRVGRDKGKHPDSTLVVSTKIDAGTALKITGILLGIRDDSSPEAMAVKDSLKIRGFVVTTEDDFADTLELLKRAGVTRDFNFTY